MTATTLEPITAEGNNTDRHATAQRSAGKPPGIFTHSTHLNIVTDLQTTQQRVQDPASKLPRPQSRT